MQNANHTDRMVRFIKFMAENPAIECVLCSTDDEILNDEFIEVMEKLEENGFYEMVYILMKKYHFSGIISKAITKMKMKVIGEKIKDVGYEKLSSELKDLIREEIKLRKKKPDASVCRISSENL